MKLNYIHENTGPNKKMGWSTGAMEP